MNVKNYLTIAGIIGLIYGLWFFLAPDHAAGVYGYGDVATPLSTMILKFFGISMTAGGVMAVAARGASKSIGRTAVLLYLAVSQLLYLVMNLMSMGGSEGGMNYVDLILNAVLGLGAVYFIMKDRKADAD